MLTEHQFLQTSQIFMDMIHKSNSSERIVLLWKNILQKILYDKHLAGPHSDNKQFYRRCIDFECSSYRILYIIQIIDAEEPSSLQRACFFKLLLLFATSLKLVRIVIHTTSISIHLFCTTLMKIFQPASQNPKIFRIVNLLLFFEVIDSNCSMYSKF